MDVVERAARAVRSPLDPAGCAQADFIVFVVFVIFRRRSPAFGGGGAVGGLLARGDEDATDEQGEGEAAENPPAIFLQRIGGVDGRAETATGTVFALREPRHLRWAAPRLLLTRLQNAFAAKF